MGNIIKGSLGFNREQIVAILGSNMYKGDVAETAVKELVQNSFDAIKVAKAEGFIGEGVIEVSIEKWRRIITIKDNGCGMTPETVLSAFFTVGGSYKGDNMDNRLKSGGYGVAKVAFLFSAQSIKVDTVKNGKRTVVEATSEEILQDDFNLDVTLTDAPNGTEVTIVFPEYFVDSDGKRTPVEMWRADRFLDNPMIGDVTVAYNGSRSYKQNVPSEYLFLGTAKANFGELDLYISPSKGSSISYDVLSSGLYQFSKHVWTENNARMGINAIVNIKPYVSIKSRLYPINNQRQGFRDTCLGEVNDLEGLLKEIHNAYTKGRYAASFASCISLDVRELSQSKRIPYAGEILEDTVASVKASLGVLSPEDFSNVLSVIHTVMSKRNNSSSLDTSGINLPKAAMIDTSRFDLNKPVFHNNTTMQLEEDVTAFLKEFGAMLLEIKDLYIQAYDGVSRSVGCWGNTVVASELMKEQYWGISFDKEYTGVKVNPKLFNFIGVNPFGHKLPTYKGVDPAAIIAECIIHTIIHELNHNFASGEGSSFTSNLVITEAEFVGIGELYEEWRKSMYALVTKNIDLIVKYHKLYVESSNKGDSLKE